MPTFLSSTDLDTLEKEGKDTENFLSLVVNNKGEYTAALTFKQSVITYIEKPISLFGKALNNIKAEPQIDENVVYSRLDIINVLYNEEYIDLKEVQEEAKAKVSIANNNAYNGYIPKYNPLQQTIFSDKDFKFSSCSKYSIQDLAVKIMLGSINVVAKSVKVNEILPKLDALYIKTFGSINNATRWFEDYIDFILIDFENPTKDSNIRAQELLEYFENLETDSKVIEIIIKTIEIYIEYGN